MRCSICKKTSDEIKLFEGIFNAEMINVCENCAEDQKIPVIRKPSESQLEKAEQRYSVRERMERMSGMHDTTEISKDQIVTQGNLAKLRVPPKKQHHEDIEDNYYWALNIARRRAKMTTTQLAEKMQVNSQIIQEIEKGKIPENFEEIFIKLEIYLGIKLLKKNKTKINFIRSSNKEEEILKTVAEKMKNCETEDLVQEKIQNEEIKLSRRENLKDVTLNDLIDRKRAREKYKLQAKQNEMLGDEIDIEEL